LKRRRRAGRSPCFRSGRSRQAERGEAPALTRDRNRCRKNRRCKPANNSCGSIRAMSRKC